MYGGRTLRHRPPAGVAHRPVHAPGDWPDGGLWPEDEPRRVDAWNALLRAAADDHDAVVLDLNRRVCPDGRFTWQAGGVRIRSGGLHFTPSGVRRHIAPWLLPQLAALAVRGPHG